RVGAVGGYPPALQGGQKASAARPGLAAFQRSRAGLTDPRVAAIRQGSFFYVKNIRARSFSVNGEADIFDGLALGEVHLLVVCPGREFGKGQGGGVNIAVVVEEFAFRLGG